MLENIHRKRVANVGDRIEYSGHYGTIKYIGEIEGTLSTWLGIDWDDPNRGKHAGMYNNIQYFEAKYPKSGSFVRPDKVYLGRSLINALCSRYGVKDDRNNDILLIKQHEMNAPFLEMVGFDKLIELQGHYVKLEQADARYQQVSYISDEPGQLQQMFPNIRALDISKNLFNSWDCIYNICAELKYLSLLNVSENKLSMPLYTENHCFKNLKILIVGAADATWDDLNEIFQSFPNVEEIIAPNNEITTISVGTDQFRTLKLLDLENNLIGDWKQILELSKLRNLETLNLENCGIKEIYFSEDTETATNDFESLKKLNIKNNYISEWESIGELNKLKNLNNLMFSKNPLFEKDSYDTCTQLAIARLSKIEVLNGTIIKDNEHRRGAEYDYLKKYGLEWLTVKHASQEIDFLRKHNRYLELIKKYGELEESELKQEEKTIIGTLVEVELQYGNKRLKKKLPPTLTVQKLIMLTQKVFQLSTRPTLTYQSDDIVINFDDDCKELSFYAIRNGDKIVISD